MEGEDLRAKKVFSRVGMGLFLMVIAIFIGNFIMSSIIILINPEIIVGGFAILLLSEIIVLLFGFLVFYVVTKGIEDSEKGEVLKISLKSFLGFLLVSIAFMIVSNILGTIINTGIARIRGETGFYDPVESILSQENMILMSLYVVVVGPIMEELVFRKIMLDKIRRFGELPAIIISSIAFGLYHMNLAQFFYAFAVGLVFAYITLKTNTVFYAIILHMIINLRSVIITPFIGNEFALAIIVLINIIAAIAGLIIFISKSKNIKFEVSKEPVKKKSLFVLNLGSILYIGLTLLIIIYIAWFI